MTDKTDLPQPGTDEPDDAPAGEAGSGPGNVSVDEPTAGALDDEAGTPGGESDEDDDSTSGSDDSTSGNEDTSDNTADRLDDPPNT